MGQTIKSLASFCLSVCLRSDDRNFYSILMKFFTEVGPRKVRKLSLGSKSDAPFSSVAPIFHPRNCIFYRKVRSSEHRSNEARGPIMEVKSSNDVPIDSGYKHKVAKCCNHHQFCPIKHKNIRILNGNILG